MEIEARFLYYNFVEEILTIGITIIELRLYTKG